MELNKRMKNYENVSKNYLECKTPVIIRLDGRAFHTFTKGLNKPYDKILMKLMQETMEELCRNISNCRFGYTQSDEISLLLLDDRNENTQAWFNNNVQKIVSVTASMATLYFNKFLEKMKRYWDEKIDIKFGYYRAFQNLNTEQFKNIDLYRHKGLTAHFDCRAFNIPYEEICNYFIWRQQDATRNAIQSAGQSEFKHKELQNKNCDEIKEMLSSEKSIDFDNYPTAFKRGSACICGENNWDDKWKIDTEIPVFTQNKDYITKRLIIVEDNEEWI